MPSMEEALAKAWKFKQERDAGTKQQQAEAEEQSYASAWMLEFRQRRGDPILPVTLEGEGETFECCTKILSDEDESHMGVLMASRGYTLTPITDLRFLTLISAALIYVGTTAFEDENKPRFDSFEQVEKWIKEPGMGAIIAPLRAVILYRNPLVKKKYFPNLEEWSPA